MRSMKLRSLAGPAVAAILLSSVARAAPDASLEVEKTVAAICASPEVSIVHFWAPWCGNCKAELKEGWPKFLAAHPELKVVFVSFWADGDDGRSALSGHGISDSKNLTILAHPGPRRGAERPTGFMNLPITWIPTTWVFREGKLCFAFNYGELRFEMLEQMIKDARAEW